MPIPNFDGLCLWCIILKLFSEKGDGVANQGAVRILLIARIFKNCVTHASVRTQDFKTFCFTEQVADVGD